MDREQHEIQVLGFFGIFKEAFNIITSHKKIFSQITLSVILPLSFIYLAQNEISRFLFGEINPHKNITDTEIRSGIYSKASDIFSSEWTNYWLFKLACFIFSILLSLVSTSAVVYTIACIYSAKEITCKKVMKVVPKVWKGLMINFLWISITFFALIMGSSLIVLVLILVVSSFNVPITAVITVCIILLLIISLLGFGYMSFVWHLANVISILEEVHGIQAMVKSKNLIMGNTGVCAATFVVLNICYLGIDHGFKASVVGGESFWGEIFHACLWSMIMSILSLFGIVMQTIMYFICKSYHRENINKSSLTNHLEVYRREYVQLDAKDISMV